MKYKGKKFNLFGCMWIIDDVYTVSEDDQISNINPFGLCHPIRYKAHVIECPTDYIGIREIDAPLTDLN